MAKKKKRLSTSLINRRLIPDVVVDVFKFLQKKDLASCELSCVWWNKITTEYQDVLPLKRVHLVGFCKGEFHFTTSEVNAIYNSSNPFRIDQEYYGLFKQCYFEKFEFPWHPDDLREAMDKLMEVQRVVGRTITARCFSHFIYFKTLSTVSYSSYLKSLKFITMDKAEIGINWTRRKGLKRFIQELPKKVEIHFYRDWSDATPEISAESLVGYFENGGLSGKDVSLSFHVPKPQKFYKFMVENVQRLNIGGRFSISIRDDSPLSDVENYMKSRPGVIINKSDPTNSSGYERELIIEKEGFDFKCRFVEDPSINFYFPFLVLYYVIENKQ